MSSTDSRRTRTASPADDPWDRPSYFDAYSRRGWRESADFQAVLRPLCERLREYDDLRCRLEADGGTVQDLAQVTTLLSQPVALNTAFGKGSVALAAPDDVRAALYGIRGAQVHFQVRRLDTGMPAYYLCCLHRDYWAEHDIIVEDLYRSPGYPSLDDRFERLMQYGHETYCLRLSAMRAKAGALLGGDDAASWRVDEMLYDVGRHVFEAAWHEDQRVGMQVARHFGLPRFREAIELLYLCLSGELCELRSAVRPDLLRFFEDVYPQPAIRSFLDRLPGLDGEAVARVPETALRLYARLSGAFGRLIRTEVDWGVRRARLPVYKLLFANARRLDILAPDLQAEPTVQQATRVLDEVAAATVDDVLAAALVTGGTRDGMSMR